MTSLWMVTPAWKRLALSAVVFEQHRRVLALLSAHGIDGYSVVIADDENLDLARSCGFETVERNNEWLGRRFNDGIEYAAKHGADYIVPIGSDSFIDPAFFLDLPARPYIRTSGLYCAVEPERLAELDVRTRSGAGPYVIPRASLKRSRFRPAQDKLKRRIDSSTVRALGTVRWRFRDLHPFQYVGFRLPPLLTPYQTLQARWGVREHPEPWRILARHYPVDLVAAARNAIS